MRPHPMLNMADAVHVERIETNFFCHRPGSWGLAGAALVENSGSMCANDSVVDRRDLPSVSFSVAGERQSIGDRLRNIDAIPPSTDQNPRSARICRLSA